MPTPVVRMALPLLLLLGCSGKTSRNAEDAPTAGARPGAGGSISAGGGAASAGGGATGTGDASVETACGDGAVEGGEGCDDGNAISGDGCSAACVLETGFSCESGGPTVCREVCGDGIRVGAESATTGCDDRNTTAGDGCSTSCTIEEGWTCAGSGASVCNRSCFGMQGTECGGRDCCASPLVPGGTFEQGEGSTFDSTVSSFRLDAYEVTVGRFRSFVRQHDAWRSAGSPLENDGAHPGIAGSGWKAEWNDFILPSVVSCPQYSEYTTWAAEGRDVYPMNCVTWHTAFAFCIWDGGRLPTESEWEFAAAGGPSDTSYPWGDTPVPSDAADGTAAFAVYAGLDDGVPGSMTGFDDIQPVGSKPAGRGVYGQEDLAGSLWEMTLDVYDQKLFVGTATDHANLDESAGSQRVGKGGSWESGSAAITATSRYGFSVPYSNDVGRGFRCARDP